MTDPGEPGSPIWRQRRAVVRNSAVPRRAASSMASVCHFRRALSKLSTTAGSSNSAGNLARNAARICRLVNAQRRSSRVAMVLPGWIRCRPVIASISTKGPRRLNRRKRSRSSPIQNTGSNAPARASDSRRITVVEGGMKFPTSRPAVSPAPRSLIFGDSGLEVAMVARRSALRAKMLPGRSLSASNSTMSANAIGASGWAASTAAIR